MGGGTGKDELCDTSGVTSPRSGHEGWEMGGTGTQPRSCGSEGWTMVAGGRGHGPVAPTRVAAGEWHHASTTAAICPHPPASPQSATAPSSASPPRNPQLAPGTASGHSPSVNFYFSWCWGTMGGTSPAPLQKTAPGGVGGALAAPLAPHRSGGTRDVLSRGLPRTGPPWQHSGHGEPPTVPLAAPPAPPGSLGTTRTLRRERGVSTQSGDPGTWGPQKLGSLAHVAARPH